MKRRNSTMLEGTNRIAQYCVPSSKLLAAMEPGKWFTSKDLALALSLPGVTPQKLGKQLSDLLETGKVKRKTVSNVFVWQKY